MVKRKTFPKEDPNPNGETVESVRAYLKSALEGTVKDPPDGHFQRGYAACLESLWEDLFMTAKQRKAHRAGKYSQRERLVRLSGGYE